MSQVSLSMRKIEEILRLKFEVELTHRAIAQSCGVSASTVSEYITHAKAAGLSWPLPEGMTTEQLEAWLYPDKGSSGRVIPQPDWKYIHKELKRKGVTLSLLWIEYRQEHPHGCGYSQFCHRYREWRKHLNPTMRQKHKAGEKLFVDYAGQTVEVGDPETGQIREAQIFVTTLGASSYMLRLRSAQALCRSALVTEPAQLDRGACAGAGIPRRCARTAGAGQSQGGGDQPEPV